jgi:hypothetical protein
MGGAGAASPDGGTGGGSVGTGSSASATGVGSSVARRVDPRVLRARVAAEGAISSPVTSTMGGPPEVHTLPPLAR